MYLNRKNNTSTYWSDGDRAEQIEVDENLIKSGIDSTQETQPSTTVNDSKQPRLINEKGMTFLIVIPILLLALGFILKMGLKKISKNHLKFNKYHPKIGCRQCHYFDKNQYLKCAVHPDKVLTKKAKVCRDYQAKSDIKNCD